MIPVLLVLVYPGPASARSVQPPPQRASDADREIAADILCAAVGDGRLTLDELDDRLGAALSARTMTELAALIADLPGRPSAPSTASQAAVPAAVRGKATAPPSAAASSRWQIIQSHCPAVRTPAGA